VKTHSTIRRAIAGALALCTLAACGGSARELAGYSVDPVPAVGAVALPDLTAGGADFPFVAKQDDLLVVYFGYTNCPDACPTTMSNVKLARQRLDDPGRVQVAMVSIDPDRDLDVLADYVTSFVADGHALGTAEQTALRKAADAFGVSYDVTTGADGKPEVAHTTLLYAIDDTGHVVLAWPLGVGIDDLAADFDQLLGHKPSGGY